MLTGGDDPTKLRAGRDGFRLVVFWEGGHEVVSLRPDARLVLGRADDSDVCVPDESVSRRHAALSGTGGVWQVEDLGSSNGTVVGGERLARGEVRAVSPGTIVQIGDARFLLDGSTDPRAAPATAEGAPEGADSAMERVHKLLPIVSASMLSVLILGETGVGKGRLAEEIHRQSGRADGPFVRLNCAAVPEALLESELFGHERGAFTGAARTKPGILETASGGTAFLDEVGEIPSSTQAKLLHVLEHGEVMRVGALEPRPIDVRFIAATNQSVVAGGALRRDLYFRLAGMPLRIPPLRERTDEIPAMARSFIEEACAESHRECPGIAPEAMAALVRYPWPGNVRELRNVVARAALVSGGQVVQLDHLMFEAPELLGTEGAPTAPPPRASGAALPSRPTKAPLPEPTPASQDAPSRRLESDMRDYERQRIAEALARFGGHQGKAAEHLGISRRTLTNKLNELALPRPRKGKNEPAE